MLIAFVFKQYFFGVTIFLVSTFLILLILVQRGRGGGLAGALGGPGGGSVFGSKAGDVFTRITIVTAALWILLCAMGVYWMQEQINPLGDTTSSGGMSFSTDAGMNPGGSLPLDTGLAPVGDGTSSDGTTPGTTPEGPTSIPGVIKPLNLDSPTTNPAEAPKTPESGTGSTPPSSTTPGSN